ncbi:MAG: hypothetical protein ACSNEK_08725 [Parachlamydiaceae bacterium]
MSINNTLTNFHLENYQFYKIEQTDNAFAFTRLNDQDFLIQRQLTSLITEGLLALYSTTENRVYLNKNFVKKIDESSLTPSPKIAQFKNSLNILSPVNVEVEFCEITDELQLNLQLAASVINPEVNDIPIAEGNGKPQLSLPKRLLPLRHFYGRPLLKNTNPEELILRKSVLSDFSPYQREREKDEIANQKKRNKEYQERLAEEKQSRLKDMALRYSLKQEHLRDIKK